MVQETGDESESPRPALEGVQETGEDSRETDDYVDTLNSGWGVGEHDYRAGDVRPATEHSTFDEDARIVAIPDEPIEERDPGVTPKCAFCNQESQLQERLYESMRAALDEFDYEAVQDMSEEDMMIPADYVLIGIESGEFQSFACHACIQ